MRLLINYVFKPDKYSKTHRTLEILTYPVDITRVEGELEGYILSSADYNKEIGATHYTTSQKIWAWNDITITGDLTTDPGVTVEIVAGHSVVTKSNVKIGPNIIVKTELPDICGSTYPATPAVVKAFCSGSNYKANTYQARGPSDNDNSLSTRKGIGNENKLIIKCYPNPASNIVFINYSLPVNSKVSLILTNLVGEKVKEIVNEKEYLAGENMSEIDVSDIPSGVYCVTLKSAFSSVTKQIVVVK